MKVVLLRRARGHHPDLLMPAFRKDFQGLRVWFSLEVEPGTPLNE